ncbi:hypothetical protein [Actinoplanes auranticolor]|uniref:Uncharacterized protein n=1 Tax=Actinoplanes auranticolor TaxID=47988 RepID=A0A919VMX5_9ACTN|nr:hypothetical protein [Actinoplanes auranticolor]GIM72144.1 hypothetical protein Aau02nite_49490 [Actinoplanes auranticolor]
MLKRSWYLPDTDWISQLPGAPKLDKDGQAVIARLAEMLSHRFPGDPALTVAATHVVLLAADYLGDTTSHHTRCHDLTEVARLICGLNLVQAHLTQTIQRIAMNTDARAYPGTVEVPAELLRAVTDSLSTAGVNSELLAAHLKEAHLLLRRREQ